MLNGKVLDNYAIGPLLNQQKYYDIYASRNTMNGNIFSIKVENLKNCKNVLNSESSVLKKLNATQYFPKLYDYGTNGDVCWLTIDLIGPSLAETLTFSRDGKFTVDTSLKVSLHVVKMIKLLHSNGFVHRNLDLTNINIRLAPGLPLCVSDLSNAREYRDPVLHTVIPPRSSFEALDINKYSSINVHSNTDFSRRDDLISWFYITIDLLIGLPWDSYTNPDMMLNLKKNYDVEQNVKVMFPEFVEIWSYLLILSYYDEPNYEFIETRVIRCIESNGYKNSNTFDWDDYLSVFKANLSAEFGIKFDRKVDDLQVSMSELGVPSSLIRVSSSSLETPSPGPCIFIGGSNQTKSYCC